MFDFAYFLKSLTQLLPYTGAAISIMGYSVLYGILWGGLLAWAKLGKNKVLKQLSYGYTTLIRCTPSIVLLYVIYYGLPMLLQALHIHVGALGKKEYIIITFAMFCGASLSEVFRSAYCSVSIGQYEAGVSIGLGNLTVFRRIIFPQMFQVTLPPLGNTVIAVLNEASLGFAIGYVDIIGRATLFSQQNYGTKNLEIFFAAAILYWLCSVVIGQGVNLIERYYGRYRSQY
jgi:L-cystine transport system permease protein